MHNQPRPGHQGWGWGKRSEGGVHNCGREERDKVAVPLNKLNHSDYQLLSIHHPGHVPVSPKACPRAFSPSTTWSLMWPAGGSPDKHDQRLRNQGLLDIIRDSQSQQSLDTFIAYIYHRWSFEIEREIGQGRPRTLKQTVSVELVLVTCWFFPRPGNFFSLSWFFCIWTVFLFVTLHQLCFYFKSRVQFQVIYRSGQPLDSTYNNQSFSWQVELPSQLYLKYDGVEYRGDRNDIIVAKYVNLNKWCPYKV